MRRRATLVSRMTGDGWDVIKDDVPLGKVYYVEIESAVTLLHGNSDHPKEMIPRLCVMTYDQPQGGDGGYMIAELLKIEPEA